MRQHLELVIGEPDTQPDQRLTAAKEQLTRARIYRSEGFWRDALAACCLGQELLACHYGPEADRMWPELLGIYRECCRELLRPWMGE